MSNPTPAFPEIDRSDLGAVRRFLTAGREDDPQTRRPASFGGPKAPTVSHGITRARRRSAARAAD